MGLSLRADKDIPLEERREMEKHYEEIGRLRSMHGIFYEDRNQERLPIENKGYGDLL